MDAQLLYENILVNTYSFPTLALLHALFLETLLYESVSADSENNQKQ